MRETAPDMIQEILSRTQLRPNADSDRLNVESLPAYHNGEYLSGYNVSGGGTKYKTGGLTGTFKFVLTTDSTTGLYCTLYAIQGTNV